MKLLKNALSKSGGLIIAVDKKNNDHIYSSKMACPKCDITFEELQPRMFSFNSPFGACEECSGLGIKMDFDANLIIPDKSKCIADGAIAIYRNAIDGWRGQYVGAVAKSFGFDIFSPISFLTKEQYNVLMYGSDKKIKFSMQMNKGDSNWSHTGTWEGLLPQSERLFEQTQSDYRRRELEKFMRISSCGKCKGKRLKKKVLSVRVSEKIYY